MANTLDPGDVGVMRPDARVASAIEIVDEWLASEIGLDRILVQWARKNRYAGSGDRTAIADLVYGAVRRLRSANWVGGGDEPVSGRTALHGTTLLDAQDPAALFTGAKHAANPLTDGEISRRRQLETAPRSVRLDYPDWLEVHLAEIDDSDLNALRSRAALDLRVNTLKATSQQASVALAQDGISVEGVAGVPLALRVVEGARKVMRSQAYIKGLVEIQDAGSQSVASLAAPLAGELVIDLCAGGGGKSLAMASESGGKARIKAYDRVSARMSDLPKRAERAGALIEIIQPEHLPGLEGQADLVLVDAPCSGSGAWRRNPDAKWRFTSKRLAELIQSQSALLGKAAMLCKPEGRIVYVTCSILNVENMNQIETFLEHLPAWKVGQTFQSLPAMGMDGLFGAVLSQSLDSR